MSADQVPPTIKPPVRHDFTYERCCWGWNALHYAPADERGPARGMFVGRGIKNGDLIDMTFSSGRRSMRVGEVEYSTSPPDLFECNLYPVPNPAADRGGERSQS